jgi:hypothetical protein
MELNKDFRDLRALLSARNADYLIVGGYAVAFYGAPRFTGDIDLFIRPAEESASRMLEAVRDLGFPTAGVTTEMLLERNTIVQLGRVPRRIHLMSSISGVTWETAWNSRKPGTYMDVKVFYIGREELIADKRACGRTKDLADVEAPTKGESH